MISFFTAIILLHIWITIVTITMVITWFNMIESVPYHTLGETAFMFCFAILAGMAWPITLPVAFVLTIITAIEDIFMYFKVHHRDV